MSQRWREKVILAIQLFILSAFLTQTHDVLSCDDIPIKICNNTSTSEDQSHFSSTSSNNLKSLFSVLISNATRLKFYNTSIGNDADLVYGQFMCLDYSSTDHCSNCTRRATEELAASCPNTSEAIVWEEICQLRISGVNFFGKLEPPEVQQNKCQKNPQNFSDVDADLLSSVVNKTLNELAGKAAFDPMMDNFATKEVNTTTNKTLYSLVQCAPDLSTADCSSCLNQAIADVRRCCSMSLGARVLSQNCYLRYELYPFYGAINETENPGNRSRANKWMTVYLPITIVCAVVALLCSCFGWFTVRRWKEENDEGRWKPLYAHQFFKKLTDSQSTEAPCFHLGSILAATNRFSDKLKLGEGGFGPVYKGVLRDGTEVAVKRLQEIFSQQGSEEFKNEVTLIMKLQHNNLVRLLGFWAEGEERLLVYEYMPNSSLDVFLFDPRRRIRLNWSRRLNIITGIARGMLYLHEDSRQKIIHRDLKPSNILLDADLNPKISDFGIARIFAGTEVAANTTTIVGTYGYMAPEYAMEGLYSVKSDVYSFGVLLLEIVTGKRNVGFSSTKLAASLLAYAWQMWNQGKALELMDPLLHGSCPAEELIRCVHIGLLCVQEDPLDRPTMSAVMVMLKKDSAILHHPQRPAFSTCQFIQDSANMVRPHGGSISINCLTISDALPR